MGLFVVIVVALVVVGIVVWAMWRGGRPEEAAAHAHEPEKRDKYAGRSLAGPADAGAEDQRPIEGDPSPG